MAVFMPTTNNTSLILMVFIPSDEPLFAWRLPHPSSTFPFKTATSILVESDTGLEAGRLMKVVANDHI
jgi:hypothetical protein